MIRSSTEVLPQFRSNHPKVLVDRKIAATIPREDSPVKIKPYLRKRERRARTSSAKSKNVPHVTQPGFFPFDACDAPSRIGGN
jgi:hypothetical protein